MPRCALRNINERVTAELDRMSQVAASRALDNLSRAFEKLNTNQDALVALAADEGELESHVEFHVRAERLFDETAIVLQERINHHTVPEAPVAAPSVFAHSPHISMGGMRLPKVTIKKFDGADENG